MQARQLLHSTQQKNRGEKIRFKEILQLVQKKHRPQRSEKIKLGV